MRIAIMQPYFIPYAGYFRLFCATDLFVIYDCVQFLRRGWVHRNRLPNVKNELEWLTLPLLKAPQDVLIKDLEFANPVSHEWSKRLRIFPQLSGADGDGNELLSHIVNINDSPLAFITTTLNVTCKLLNLPFNVFRSSTLDLPTTVKGEDKIIAIANYFNAKEYVNLAGGKALYNHDKFKHHGLKLRFLSDYQGSYESILQRLINDSASNLQHEIITQSTMDTL